MTNRKSILVAEDNEIDILLLHRAFLKAGIDPRIHFVRDGQQAIEYLNGEAGFADRNLYPFPRVMLLDLKMPRLDGFAVLEWVREHPRFKRLIVVVLTNSGLDKDVDRAYELGANSFITKPLDDNNLSELSRKLHDYWVETNRCSNVE